MTVLLCPVPINPRLSHRYPPLLPMETPSEPEESLYGIDDISQKFQDLLAAIDQRIKVLAGQTEKSVTGTRSKVDQEIDDVDKEISRLKDIMKTCDDLEMEFTKIRQIGEIAGDFVRRLKAVESDLK